MNLIFRWRDALNEEKNSFIVSFSKYLFTNLTKQVRLNQFEMFQEILKANIWLFYYKIRRNKLLWKKKLISKTRTEFRNKKIQTS